jgi:hypothetical protein
MMDHRVRTALQDGRASSAPPHVSINHSSDAQEDSRMLGSDLPSSVLSHREDILAAHLDIMPVLQHSISSVVKSRNGSVLSRGFILKTDHYPSGEWCIQTSDGYFE